MKILIDFDDVIFDTETFKEKHLFGAFEQFGVSAGDVKKRYAEYRILLPKFSLSRFINYVIYEHKVDTDEEKINEIVFTGVHKLVFEFISKLATKFGEDNITLLTFGDREFQERKINGAGVRSLFAEIIYTEEDKADFVQRYALLHGNEKVIFIDDSFRHFVREGIIPKNLTQICLDTLGKLKPDQIVELNRVGAQVETDRSKIYLRVLKVWQGENKETKRLK